MSCFSHSQDKGQKITGLNTNLRALVIQSVCEYLRVAPNADLGEASTRENIRSAFFRIRVWTKKRGLRGALQELDFECYRLEDC